MSRQGIDLDRSTLADWVGRAAFELRPVFDALIADLKRSTKLFMDKTRAPVLDPGSRKTKTGYFWALARDDRPWGEVRRQASPSPMPPVEAGSMPIRYCKGSRASFRSTATRDIIGWSHRAASVLTFGLPIVGRMHGASWSRLPALAPRRLQRKARSGSVDYIATKPSSAALTLKLSWTEGKHGQRR